MEKKPNYAKRVFVAIGITFGIALLLFLVPLFIITIMGALGGGQINGTAKFILQFIQRIMPVLVILIGTPISIALACIVEKKPKVESTNKVKEEVE